MEMRRLGNGPVLSVVGLGCNNFGMKIDAAEAREVVHAALDEGITHFDTAEIYGDGKSEEHLGAALGRRRDDVVVATKFQRRPPDQPYTPGALAERIRTACEYSLRRLDTDRIDLYYQHYPDPDAPVEEVLEALAELVEEGKVLHIASSNMTADQIGAAHATSGVRDLPRFCGTQIEWNLLSRDVEAAVVPAAQTTGIGVVPYFPLASGLLTGKYRRGERFPEGSRLDRLPYFTDVVTDENFDRVEALTEFATGRGHRILDLAIAWLAAQDAVASVLTGATTAEQVRANAHSVTWQLSDDDLAEIAALL